jgi:hypothetical protein
MVVLGMCLEVIGQIVDTCGEQRHLNFRASGVVLGTLVLRHDFWLVDAGYGHVVLL